MTVLAADSIDVRAADGRELLTDISFTVSSDEAVLVCGPPGCGKTLLVKALRGLLDDRPDLVVSGTVQRLGAMGFVFQRPAVQLVRRVVRHDIAFGLENQGLPADEIEARIDRYAARFDATALLDREVKDLSAGEIAKVALLGSIVTEPEVLILDEPVASLDHRNTKLVLEALDQLKETSTAVVIVEHDLRDLLAWVDRVVILADGRVKACGSPRDVLPSLHSAGMKLPFATEIALELRDSGEDVTIPITEESAELESP